jgi:hypothetical protein
VGRPEHPHCDSHADEGAAAGEDKMNFKVGEKVISQYGAAEILAVERLPEEGISGRYIIKCEEGVFINYPDYLLERTDSK